MGYLLLVRVVLDHHDEDVRQPQRRLLDDGVHEGSLPEGAARREREVAPPSVQQEQSPPADGDRLGMGQG